MPKRTRDQNPETRKPHYQSNHETPTVKKPKSQADPPQTTKHTRKPKHETQNQIKERKGRNN
uniref:Uncharacterized protein n=1 Tax=Nelumbo nucifera TaxID=4432 RepID=A0A822YDP8_NELNU|nr:TPA_asm: hypothetical protein HUJ06_030644 [Nelumbo nucifera]